MERTPLTPRVYLAAATVLGAALLGACRSHTVIDAQRLGAATMDERDALVILRRGDLGGQPGGGDFVDCLGERLASGERPLRVVPAGEFADHLYPWFEPRTAPTDVEALRRLLARPLVGSRIDDLGIRFVVWVNGDTETVARNGSMGCAVGPGGGGCFGFVSWEDEAAYEAEIWSFKEAAVAGTISTETNGTSYVPALVIPVPLLARVESSACEGMADELKGFLGGG